MRSAFDKMGVEIDNTITGQQALEVKLDLVIIITFYFGALIHIG